MGSFKHRGQVKNKISGKVKQTRQSDYLMKRKNVNESVGFPKKIKFDNESVGFPKKIKFDNESVGFPKKIKFDNESEDEGLGSSTFKKPDEDFAVKYLLVKPGHKWYDQISVDSVSKAQCPVAIEEQLKKEAEFIYKEDVIKYQKFLVKRQERSDFMWIKTILKSGTLSDKISAHTLLIQDSPVYNLNSIDALISMVTPKGKRECLMVLASLKDLFLSDLLIEEKKLKSFNQHPLEKLNELASGNISSRKKRLLLWYFEDKLKELYSKFVKNLEIVSRDTVEKTKQKAVTVMQELLQYNPEQEQFLLENLVNKIGDPLPKVGSHVCHLLGQLVGYHRNMMAIVVQEVERLLFRQNVSERAKYYCLCFLNQLIFDHEKSDIAGHLVTMYFGLFKMCIRKGEVNNKIMSALLTGVARAYPYAKLKNNVIMEQLDAMFRLVHLVSFNISVQALMLIFQVLDSKDSVSDRFYSSLYRKLLDPGLSCSSRQSMLLNLVYRALKKDIAQVRIKAFIKRLIQVSLNQTPNLQCGILMMISELSNTHPDLLETKSVALYSDSDSEENYQDVQDDDEQAESSTTNEKTKNNKNTSWVHRQIDSHKTKQNYDPQNRNPLHSGAEYSSLWELKFLEKSFHPSVSLFAHQIATSRQINYSGDPLQDFTIIRFLDRFVYRNPKKMSNSAKANVHRKVFGKKISSEDSHKVPVLDDSFINQDERKVPADEKFIYHYLRRRALQKKKDEDSDLESVCSDDFEKFLNDIHPEDEGKGTVDFAKELSANAKRAKSNEDSADEFGSFESESDIENEEEGDFENDEEFQSAFKDYDEDMLEAEDEDISNKDFMDFDEFKDKSNTTQRSKVKKKSKNEENLFMSADEFGVLIEDDIGQSTDVTSEAFVNTDKSDVKQLAWEKQRDQFVRGTDWKSRKRFKKNHFVSKRKNKK